MDQRSFPAGGRILLAKEGPTVNLLIYTGEMGRDRKPACSDTLFSPLGRSHVFRFVNTVKHPLLASGSSEPLDCEKLDKAKLQQFLYSPQSRCFSNSLSSGGVSEEK